MCGLHKSKICVCCAPSGQGGAHTNLTAYFACPYLLLRSTAITPKVVWASQIGPRTRLDLCDRFVKPTHLRCEGQNVCATTCCARTYVQRRDKKMHGSHLTHLRCEGVCTRFVLPSFIFTNPKSLLDMICYAFLSTCVHRLPCPLTPSHRLPVPHTNLRFVWGTGNRCEGVCKQILL